MKKRTLKKIVDFSVFVFAILAAAYLVLHFVTERTRVSGSSMETTFFDGDNVMIDKLSYRFRNIRRNEIICFSSKKGEETLIKRVIGLPGETVRISGGSIYIDGEPIDDYIGGLSFAGRAEEDVVLGSGEYFVLGDNRGDSIDSRFEEIGNVRKKDIVGRAVLIFYPFSRVKVIGN